MCTTESILFSNNQPKDYGSAKAYAKEILDWYNQSQAWLSYQQFTIMQNFQMLAFQQQAAFLSYNAINQQQLLNNQRITPDNERQMAFYMNFSRFFRLFRQQPNAVTQTLVVQQHTIPSFFRRIVAEAIDYCLIFFIKLMIVYLLVELEIIDIYKFDKLGTTSDLQTLLSFTQDLVNFEIVCKFFSAIIEAFCITYGLMHYPIGCTPGKFIMKLRVISCIDVQPVAGFSNRVNVTSLLFVSFKDSILRSLMKNVVTVFLFPLSTLFYLFSFNRAIYDVTAKTIVVSV